MRLPSLLHVSDAARHAAARFPLAVLCGVLTAAIGVMASMRGADDEFWLRLAATTTLGLPLFIALTVAADRNGSSGKQGLWLLRLFGVLALAGLWLAWPAWTEGVRVRLYFQISLGLHLAVAVMPFLLNRSANGYWHFNRILFTRFLISALYSAVLFAGLSIALLAIDKLFGIKIQERFYLRLWMIIAFVFNTWYFVGGVPEDLEELETRSEYPAGLRVFSQFILVPLVTVYLTILTVYLGRVVLTGEWPSGWIGWLVSCVSTAGILSLLLIHPIRDQSNQRWARTYARVFYVALLPSIVMLLLAIGKRIQQYGVTEDRYFLVVLALWLSGIALFFIVRRNGDIRVIPATLCVVALVTTFGPWGAYSMSRGSQSARLETLLERHSLVVDGRLQQAANEVPFDDRKEISAVLFYLLERHGSGSLTAVTSDTVGAAAALEGSTKRWQRRNAALEGAQAFMGKMGLGYLDVHALEAPTNWGLSAETRPDVVDLSGYDYRIEMPGNPSFTKDVGGVVTSVRFDGLSESVVVRRAAHSVTLPLAASIENARQRGTPFRPAATRWVQVKAEGDSLRAFLQIDNMHGVTHRESTEVQFMNGSLYLGVPKPR